MKKNNILENFKTDKKMTIELAKNYIYNFDYCLELFGAEILKKQLEKFNFSDFYDLVFLPVDELASKEYEGSVTDLNQIEKLNKYQKMKIEISELSEKDINVSDNEWNDEISDYNSYYDFVKGYFVKVPKFNEFHNIYKMFFVEMFPYLKDFTFFIGDKCKIIFIDCGLDNGACRPALYVPFDALKLNDFEMIEVKTRSYFEGYFDKYAKNGIIRGSEFSTIEEALFCLSTTTCKSLKNILNNLRSKQQ